MIDAAALAHRRGDDRAFAEVVHRLVAEDPGLVEPALDIHLGRSLRSAWEWGWQPADIARFLRRTHSTDHEATGLEAIAAEARSSPANRVPSRWLDQLVALGADPAAPALRVPTTAHTLTVRLEVLSAVRHLPRMARLGPIPGDAEVLRAAPGTDPRMLERVRALLAKAESTTFPEEAEALTAKAQELMARHAIDRAMLDDGSASSVPSGRRLAVDDPYAVAKAILLGTIAEANRCRSVFASDLGSSDIFGFEGDLDLVELLYTSLLVQGTSAMLAAGSRTDRSGRSRTRSFRQSFLLGYGSRIGARLRQAVAASQGEAQQVHGDRLLPVLARRVDEVEDAMSAAYPKTTSMGASMSNPSGYAAGTVAGDLATLDVRTGVEGGAAG